MGIWNLWREKSRLASGAKCRDRHWIGYRAVLTGMVIQGRMDHDEANRRVERLNRYKRKGSHLVGVSSRRPSSPVRTTSV